MPETVSATLGAFTATSAVGSGVSIGVLAKVQRGLAPVKNGHADDVNLRLRFELQKTWILHTIEKGRNGSKYVR